MARLYANKEAIKKEFTNVFLRKLSRGAEALKDDIDRKKTTVPGYNETPEVFIAIENEIKKVKISIEGNIAFVMDNYGTGSLMSTDNPNLSSYQNSDLWNPVRKGNYITGRKKGKYTNITGTHSTSGKFEGQILEGKTIDTESGGKIKIEPHAPSGALESAIDWFYEDWFKRCIEETKKEFDISKYLEYR